MRGRRPSGPEYVDHLSGSPLAKERLKVVLETLAGTCRIGEACERLRISEPRFYQLRDRMLKAGLQRMEPRQAGRPARQLSPAEEEVQALKEQLADMEVELRAAQARAEIALALPNVVQTPEDPEASQKKNESSADEAGSEPNAPTAWQEEEHMKRLQNLCRLNTADIIALSRSGMARQQSQRRLEQSVRLSIVNFSVWTGDQGWTLPETAELLRMSPRTLRQWQADQRQDLLQVHALGRPILRSPVQQRNQVIELLDTLGPSLGVPTLRESFPHMPRAELADLLQRYRRVWRKRNCQALRVLHWQQPGTVWAMDFAEPPASIDGLYPYLLAVRDLASGQQLQWLPVSAPTAEATLQALASLFAEHGPPLILKTDNGSAFGAGEVLDFLHQAGVIPLFSPPHWPRYNGAIEAGIGSLKTRTERQASSHGHPTHWTLDDASAAQHEANATARPQGATGPTPDQAWSERPAITTQQRALFQEAINRHRQEARIQEGHPMEGPLQVQEQRAVDRQAIRRALEEHGLLLYRRRRLPLPIKGKKVAEIS